MLPCLAPDLYGRDLNVLFSELMLVQPLTCLGSDLPFLYCVLEKNIRNTELATLKAGHTMEWNVNLPSSRACKIFHTIPFHT